MRHSHHAAPIPQKAAAVSLDCKTVSSSLDDATSTTVRSSSCALSESSPSPLLWDCAEEDDGGASQRATAAGSAPLDVSRPPSPRTVMPVSSRIPVPLHQQRCSPCVVSRTRTLYLIRHAESESNALGNSFALVDPGLTAVGVAQAQHLARLLSDRPPTLVLSSSLTRALATANLAFPCRKSAPLVALEGIREIVGRRCISELRRPRGKLRDAFPAASFDFIAHDRDPMTELAVDFDHRCAGPGERRMSLEARAARMWSVLAAAPHCPTTERIAVVSHFHFLTYLCDAMLREDDASASSGNNAASFAASNTVVDQEQPESFRDIDRLKMKLERWCNGGVVEVTLEFSTSSSSSSATEVVEGESLRHHSKHRRNDPLYSCPIDCADAAVTTAERHDWSAIQQWLAPLVVTDPHGATTSESRSANNDDPTQCSVSSLAKPFSMSCGSQFLSSPGNTSPSPWRSAAVEQARIRVRDWNVLF